MNILVFIMCLPCDILSCAIKVYIVYPFTALKAGVIVAWKGEIDSKYMVTRLNRAGDIPALKTFEQLGEAIPQAILCLLFTVNNFPFLLYDETSILPIPMSCISLVFSIVSVVMGLYSGIPPLIRRALLFFDRK